MSSAFFSQHLERPHNTYRGRFAPSPSGLLHFGSLIAALASFLDAKSNQGTWLVRIEDIDPPREQAGASQNILNTLDAFGLHWDESVLYQSQQSEVYRDVLEHLATQQLSYYCRCTRAEIKKIGGIYQGHCRSLNHPKLNTSTKVRNDHGITHYTDLIQGKVSCNKALAQEDFTLVRKDGLFAYQLAVVVDDIYQNISHVIRGCDLLEPTARQLSFYNLLDKTPPQFGHVPLAVSADGYKLSKQNKAPRFDVNKPQPALVAALDFLGQQPPTALLHLTPEAIITWAIEHWSLDNIPKKHQISFS